MSTIAKNPVTIETEPEPEPEPEPELEPELEMEPEVEPEPEPLTPKKKPGRPVGSKSKEPGKPRAKRVKIVEVEEAYVPAPTQQRTIPTSNDSNSAKMLKLLTEHAHTRRDRKADLWKSWFNR